MSTFTRIVLQERPKGDIIPDRTFKQLQVSLNELKPKEKEVLVKVNYISLDPAMRGWLDDRRSYVPPVKIGETMRASVIGTVVEAGSGSRFSKGDIVTGTLGWAEYFVAPDKFLEKVSIPQGAQMLDFLGVLGMTGLTAYFGLLEVGKIKAGETLVVSGAAGATGSIVCQIGKIKGAKVVGIAGGPDKCKWLKETLGVDEAIDYKSADFHAQCKQKIGYLDVFFDNVGGEILDYMLTRLNKGARIALCGAISDYNSREKPSGLKSYLNLISQRARIEGFIVFDYAAQYPTALAEMAGWLAEGRIQRKFHVVEGISKAPSTLPLLFSGGNTGKLVIKVADPETSEPKKALL
jgi:NADPH-dependent curcumin reductase CurA